MINQIIKKLPYSIVQLLKFFRDLVPDYYRYGETFRTTFIEANANQFKTSQDQIDFQRKQLQILLKFSYEYVPYYKRIFDERGLKPDDIKNIEDLSKLPYLTKEIIQNNFEELIATNINRNKLVYLTTGGSSGNPLGFYEEKKTANSREWGFVAHLWSRVGYDVKRSNKFVILRGNKVKKDIVERNGRSLVLSSYHLTEKNMNRYIKEINKYNPDYIQAYPSSMELLASFVLDQNIDINIGNLKAILCSSENLYQYQKEKIEQAFKVRVFSFYGHTEHCCIAGECEKSDYYHIQSEYGIVELINEEGQVVKLENEKGEIIATGFNNYVMPFIRYKTGDIAINTNNTCECGRNYKVIRGIEGRENDQIISKSGAKISLTGIIFAQHFLAFSKIKKIQLEQHETGKVIVKIIEKELLSEEDKQEIKYKMESATKDELEVQIICVDEIPLTMRGKHKMLIQHLKF